VKAQAPSQALAKLRNRRGREAVAGLRLLRRRSRLPRPGNVKQLAVFHRRAVGFAGSETWLTTLGKGSRHLTRTQATHPAFARASLVHFRTCFICAWLPCTGSVLQNPYCGAWPESSMQEACLCLYLASVGACGWFCLPSFPLDINFLGDFSFVFAIAVLCFRLTFHSLQFSLYFQDIYFVWPNL
jgi:hypothetical protein